MSEYLEDYKPPEWAESLSNIPQHRVKLAMPNTPIHKWNLPGVPEDFQVYIKRDDMTGSTLSGNKVAKLEFLFADAIASGCRHFITCGGTQSNWCRAVAVSAAQLGMTSHLVMPTNIQSAEELGCPGNMLLDRLCGARMYFAPPRDASQTIAESCEAELYPRMKRIAEHIKSETGEKSYVCEIGGTNAVGFYGSIEAFQELITQGVQERFDDIVMATGSGGTCEGLAASNHLTGSKVRIHGYGIRDDSKAVLYNHGNERLRDVGLDLKMQDLCDVIDGRQGHGEGHGVTTQEDYDLIQTVARTTGIILDQTYTGRAAHGLVRELRERPDRFKGKRVLFIHTGGIFGAYDGRMSKVITTSGTDRISIWKDLDQPPFD